MQQFLVDAMLVAVILSAIPMTVIALSSGLVALIQAATQIQEQSVIHLVRLCAFVVFVMIAGDWASSEILSLFQRSVDAMEVVRTGVSR